MTTLFSPTAIVTETLCLGGPWLPGIVLVQLYALFVVLLVWSARRLPDRVTTQFSLFGRPSNHIRRTVYLVFISVFAIWLPLFGCGFYVMGIIKPGSMHIPNQAYWLSPAHLAETQDLLLMHWLWFGCLMVGFVSGLHYLIVRANRQQPARLPWGLLLVLLAYLLVGVILWSSSPTKLFEHTSGAVS